MVGEFAFEGSPSFLHRFDVTEQENETVFLLTDRTVNIIAIITARIGLRRSSQD